MAKPGVAGPQDGLAAVGHLELGEDEGDVVGNRLCAEAELVGQIFLEHYVPRWEEMADLPAGWLAKAPAKTAGARVAESATSATTVEIGAVVRSNRTTTNSARRELRR